MMMLPCCRVLLLLLRDEGRRRPIEHDMPATAEGDGVSSRPTPAGEASSSSSCSPGGRGGVELLLQLRDLRLQVCDLAARALQGLLRVGEALPQGHHLCLQRVENDRHGASIARLVAAVDFLFRNGRDGGEPGGGSRGGAAVVSLAIVVVFAGAVLL